MDKYIKDIGQCKIVNCSIIICGADVIEKDYDNSIVLIPDYLRTCPSIIELSNALSKRLHSPQMCSVAIGCICSYDYTLNHNNISSYDNKSFMSIWGHLETLKKSSSSELSSWLSACLGKRSQEGYDFKFSNSTMKHKSEKSIVTSGRKKRFDSKVTPIGTMFSEVHFGQVHNIRDAMIADANTLSTIKLLFNEPILKNDVITYDQQE